MEINEISSFNLIKEMNSNLSSENEKNTGFGEILKEKIGEVNQLQKEAEELTQSFVAGETDDFHQVILAVEKANLALELTLEVRNRLVEAYQEIWRMQI